MEEIPRSEEAATECEADIWPVGRIGDFMLYTVLAHKAPTSIQEASTAIIRVKTKDGVYETPTIKKTVEFFHEYAEVQSIGRKPGIGDGAHFLVGEVGGLPIYAASVFLFQRLSSAFSAMPGFGAPPPPDDNLLALILARLTSIESQLEALTDFVGGAKPRES